MLVLTSIQKNILAKLTAPPALGIQYRDYRATGSIIHTAKADIAARDADTDRVSRYHIDQRSYHDDEEHRGESLVDQQELDQAGDEDKHRKPMVKQRRGRGVSRLDDLYKQHQQRDEDNQVAPIERPARIATD